MRYAHIATVAAAAALLAAPALASSSSARVRVIHASPDAPSVDVLVNVDPQSGRPQEASRREALAT